MTCLKCGKKTTDEQCFCSHCLEAMEDYPVKPDVHVQLPNRPSAESGKKVVRKRRILSTEEINGVLRKRTRRLTAIVLVLAILLGAAVFLLLQSYFAGEEIEIGKNYTLGSPLE